MSKRRSSTRVGRKHPSPAALLRANGGTPPRAGPATISPPFLVDSVICRMTSGASEQIEIQEWTGMYWQPSLIPLYRMAERAPAPRDLLDARGVPSADWYGVPPRHWDTPLLIQLTSDPTLPKPRTPATEAAPAVTSEPPTRPS